MPPAPSLLRVLGAGSERVERLLEAAGVRLLRLCERLEPLGNLLEAFLASRPGHSGIHVGVFVGFTRNCGPQIICGGSDRLAGGRIADFLEILEMAVSMPRLALGGR